ncbi:IclR family transcriptional regulator [Arthrobacter pigmenti]
MSQNTAEEDIAMTKSRVAQPALTSSRKVLKILFAFSEQRLEATVPELAEIAGAPVPTTYRHVALLKELQLLEEGKPGTYHPTAKVMPLARAARLSNDLALMSRPIIAAAAERLGETTMLFQQFGDSVVCVELTECNRPVRFTFDRGHSMPLGVGASGKMALALLPPQLQKSTLEKRQGQHLQQEIERTAGRRHAVSEGELDESVWACSVPVSSENTRPVVLTVAGPAARMDQADRSRALAELRASAATIREELQRYSL